MALQTWQFGSAMVIFLAGLRQIPRMYYEAASIDGASRFQQLVYVTLPSLGPLILFNTVIDDRRVSGIQLGIHHQLGVRWPGRLDAFLHALYLSQGFVHFDFGYASALGWILIAAIALATFILIVGTRRLVHYGEVA